eukprot:TRINITY_DN8166_c0_g1_i1.p1 TRINITY_DN8166_c0_g1~~TRINITY_DN8166_c0_g1_i1.p1  ORF type:complete len:176 (-),score=60.88 TRINITY_DN8166_c0_g1_i1:38-520(-)
MDTLKSWAGWKSEPPPPKTWSQEIEEQFQMSWTTRMILVGVFMLLGLLCCTIAVYSVFMPRTFAKWYSMGSVLIMSSTFFLLGPMRQLKTMFDSTRAPSSIVYILSIIGTLYSALILKWIGLTMLCVLIQVGAMIWYALSYIPFAHSMIKSTSSSLISSV